VALYARQFQACETFYVDLLGMTVEWRPDADNVYLTSGNDNLALHRATGEFADNQHLDHIGFILNRLITSLCERSDNDTPTTWVGDNVAGPVDKRRPRSGISAP